MKMLLGLVALLLLTAQAHAVDANSVCYVVQAWQESYQVGTNSHTYSQESENDRVAECLRARDIINLLSNDKIAVEASCELQTYPDGETNCNGKNEWRVYLLKTKIDKIAQPKPVAEKKK